MIKQKKQIFFWMSGMALVMISGLFYYAHAATATISLQVTGRGIRHGTPDNANIGVLPTSTSDQEVSMQSSGYFWVDDMNGESTGHYTTIQCDGIYGPGGYMITGIHLKAGNILPERIQGLTGNVLINPELYNYTDILRPITYIYKPTSAGNAGLINIYGDKPWIKIDIPAYAPPGKYSGTIVFSFYSY